MRVLYDHDIINMYNAAGTIKAVSRLADLSEQTIRKVLATQGEYPSELCAELNAMYKNGVPVEKIAKRTGKSRKAVMSHLPYVRGRYCLFQSKNAVKIMTWRRTKKKIEKV